MRNPWPLVFQRTLGILALAAALGLLIGQTLAAITVAALGLLAWHLLHLYRLERWLNSDAEARAPRPDSIWHHVHWHCYRLQRRNRKRKRKLKRMLSRFQEAATALPDGIVLLNNHDEAIWFNTTAQELLGLRSSQDLGQSITALVRHPSFVGFLARGIYDASVEFPSPVNTERMLSVRLTPYGNKNSHKQHLLSISDISHMHRLEQTRRDFVANVSHELRTPLTVVGGYLETLLDSGEDCAQRWSQPLLSMQQQATRMHHLIEDLLMLSRLETESDPQNQRPLDIPRMLECIAEDARALSGEQNHRIQVEADPELHLYGSEKELRSAFSNLAFNAVRYSPGGAAIDIRWYVDERGAHLEVQDHGEGIAPQHLPRITERFYRVDRSRGREKGGTGLGLAIVKHVMIRHRGQLGIVSELGVGSTFSCDFPSEQIVMARKSAHSSKAC